MGQSTNAILAYGIDLDGQEGSWNLTEAQESDTNKYGYLKTAWYDAEVGVPDEDASVVDIMTRVLYEAIPGAPDVEYDFQREGPVKEHYGVWFESHCSGDYPMWILATYANTVYRGRPGTPDLAALVSMPAAHDWDAKLAAALAVLDVTPTKPAGWILASDWH